MVGIAMVGIVGCLSAIVPTLLGLRWCVVVVVCRGL